MPKHSGIQHLFGTCVTLLIKYGVNHVDFSKPRKAASVPVVEQVDTQHLDG
jgi:hypothetical protein